MSLNGVLNRHQTVVGRCTCRSGVSSSLNGQFFANRPRETLLPVKLALALLAVCGQFVKMAGNEIFCNVNNNRSESMFCPHKHKTITVTSPHSTKACVCVCVCYFLGCGPFPLFPPNVLYWLIALFSSLLLVSVFISTLAPWRLRVSQTRRRSQIISALYLCLEN